MKKYTKKERFRYWFDNHMAGGTRSMVRMLLVATIIVVAAIALVITAAGMQEEGGFFTAFWNSMATVINAWMPYSDDGEIGYIILTAIVAIVGLFFTSVLIGILSTAIEEKITDLKKGSSRVLEEDHVVVLGFEDGEYELIRQLVISAGYEEKIIVVAGDGESDEMETSIRENVELPSNVRIICRHADITDPVQLECCSIPESKVVVVSPLDDIRTIKVLLAVSSILKDTEKQVNIVTAVSDDAYLLPERLCKKQNYIMLQTNDVIAKIIARSCTQPGLSDAFTEVFNFEGSEFYIVSSENAVSHSFGDLVCGSSRSVPVGIVRDGKILLNPDPAMIIQDNDKLIVFSETRNTGEPEWKKSSYDPSWQSESICTEKETDRLLILGFNEVFDTIIKELPDNKIDIMLAGISKKQAEKAAKLASKRENISIEAFADKEPKDSKIEELVLQADHVVLLSNHDLDNEESDVKTMMNLLNIRDFRQTHDLNFTITAEMHREANRSLVVGDNPTDFVVASNLSSMVLAQMAESPELYDVYHELLANEGYDLCLKQAGALGIEKNRQEKATCAGLFTVRELRRRALAKGCIVLGILKIGELDYEITLNPEAEATVSVGEEDFLIVIG